MHFSFVTLVNSATSTNWIIIGTLIVSMLSLFVSIKSLYVWKDEIREKRKYELTKNLYFWIEKLEKFYIENIKHNNNYDNDKILIEFSKFNAKLHEIFLEYSYVIQTQTIQNIILFFKNIIDENSEEFYCVEIDEDNIITGSFNWEYYTEKENQKDFENNIELLKIFCKNSIKEFYLGKNKKYLQRRYNAKFYLQTVDKRRNKKRKLKEKDNT